MNRLLPLLISACLGFGFFYCLAPHPAEANPLLEERYCGEPKRNAAGDIIRRADVLSAFQKIHPCPSTGLKTGACRGWAKDHDIPLACGGCDSVSNLHWVPVVVKSGWQDWNKDRYERKIYAATPPIKGTENCKNEIVVITDPISSK